MIPLPSPELVRHLSRPGPRYTSYPPATAWLPMDEVDAMGVLTLADGDGPLSLYVHLPFCEEMCRFCGCNVIATRDRTRADAYLDTLEREAELWAHALPRRNTYAQLHWGGGTPTFLTLPQIERLQGIIRRHFSPTEDVEQAIEIDPAVTTVEQIALLGKLGFNRFSIGIQDLNPEVQAAVRRIQSIEQTERVIAAAREAGAKSINVDLMYGLPHQTPASIRRTVDRVLEMRPDRLALFGYAHVPWAKPNQRLLPQAALPGPYERVELFVIAARRLEEAGYRQIGLDHFALETDELAIAQREGTLSRNFQGYTARPAPDTLAMGVSAISDLGGTFLQAYHSLKEWTSSVEGGRLPIERGRWRTPDDELRGATIRMIMCLFRLDVRRLAMRYGKEAWALFGSSFAALKPLEAEGLIRLREDGLDVTPLGRLFVRNVAMEFDAYLVPQETPAFSQTV